MNNSNYSSSLESPAQKNHEPEESNSNRSPVFEIDRLSIGPVYKSTDSGNSSYHFKPRQWPIDLEEVFVEIRTNSVQLPCLIAENITFEEFATLRDDDLFHYIEFVEDKKNTQVFIVEIPSSVHVKLAGELICDLRLRYPAFLNYGRTDVFYTNNRWVEPDESLGLAVSINKIRHIKEDELYDFAGNLAPALVIESVKSATLIDTLKKFKEKYFLVKGVRVGLIMDFNSNENDVSLFKIMRAENDPNELQITQSVNGKITIVNTEIYPAYYKYKKVPRDDLPNIEIDLKSKVFDEVFYVAYGGYKLDGVERKSQIISESDDSDNSD